jgi:hypothetical protein
MSLHRRAKASLLRGFLEMLREKTDGGREHILALMTEADAGRLVWTGKSPIPRRRKK